ncbi:MAG TPA: FAD-binding oxidoreductase [Candidatus Limnocylindrales bacterium]|jgi:sarcosine oxidase subunit beta|nr:FAD-binding oxidoreductase [Candidatus Limnocylindrales bacterium]
MTDRAELVVVGAGTVGGWASVFAQADGVGRVIVLERGLAGMGASSRAAGVVRAQGGTPATVALGRWSIDFYRGQSAAYGTDSGFRELGYLILAVTEEDERNGRERVAMQHAVGLTDVRWLDAAEAAQVAGTLAPTGHRGGSYRGGDGHIDPPRNVRAYSLAMHRAGVELREQTAFAALRTTDDGLRVIGVETTAGPIETERVLLTGGPSLRAVGALAGCRVPVGAARHSVAVLEPHDAFAVDRMPMVFDIGAGLYWRLEEGGLLFGWSDPDEQPGEAREIDWAAYERCRSRLAGFVPVTRGLGLRKIWAATIDYTPDHLPILGPAIRTDGSVVEGVTIASAAGHGMMWGPGVARVAADLVLHGTTDLVEVADLGLDRFDAEGRSRLTPDPVALPYPLSAGD